MSKYRVYLITTAEHVVEVEASDGEEAVELALAGNLPYTPAFASYELGQWTTASELFPQNNKPENDYEEIN
jgi:hypothetical protein